jgi:hypothetical protein
MNSQLEILGTDFVQLQVREDGLLASAMNAESQMALRAVREERVMLDGEWDGLFAEAVVLANELGEVVPKARSERLRVRKRQVFRPWREARRNAAVGNSDGAQGDNANAKRNGNSEREQKSGEEGGEDGKADRDQGTKKEGSEKTEAK